jgi:hypothetical protein
MTKISIDIHCAYTQWGKTSLYTSEIVENSAIDYVIAMPNSILSREEVKAKLKAKMELASRTNFIIYDSATLYSSTELTSMILKNKAEHIQNIYIIMGNVSQLSKTSFFTAIHAVHSYFSSIFTSLIVDESDLYLIAHDSKLKASGRDLEFDRLIDGAPRFDKYLFYTATMYTHAFWVFGSEIYKEKYNIRWHKLAEGDNYFHFRDIVLNSRDDLSNVFHWDGHSYRYTKNFKPVEDIIDSLPVKGGSLYIHTMHKAQGQDMLRDEIIARYSHISVITANEDGVRAYYKDMSTSVKTLSAAADWCLRRSHSIIWIGGASLERMMTLTDSSAQLLLNNMILFGNKSHMTALIQLIGRMTGRYNRENWVRKLYAPAPAIASIRAAISIEEHFYSALRRDGVITQDSFKNMPHHPSNDIVPSKGRNGAKKVNHFAPPIRYLTEEDAIRAKGSDNIAFLQKKISTEEARIVSRSNGLAGGLNSAGSSLDHYRSLIEGDPTKELHKRETIFNTPDGIHIDNRQATKNLQYAQHLNLQYVATYSSSGEILLWNLPGLGETKTSYHKI